MNPLVAILFVLLPLAFAAASEKPNVLFIMADDFRPELASYGSRRSRRTWIVSPGQACNSTGPTASKRSAIPARSSTPTGKRPDTLRVWNNSTHFRELNPEVIAIPQWFKDHGYKETQLRRKDFPQLAHQGEGRSPSLERRNSSITRTTVTTPRR